MSDQGHAGAAGKPCLGARGERAALTIPGNACLADAAVGAGGLTGGQSKGAGRGGAYPTLSRSIPLVGWQGQDTRTTGRHMITPLIDTGWG